MAGGYSRRFERAGSTVIRHPYIVIGVWVAVAVVLALSFPQLERVVKSQSVDPFPAIWPRSRFSIAWLIHSGSRVRRRWWSSPSRANRG